MTYQEALKESKSGKIKKSSNAELAQMVSIVAHPGHNPEKIYLGALIANKTPREVGKMDAKGLSDLMFTGMGM